MRILLTLSFCRFLFMTMNHRHLSLLFAFSITFSFLLSSLNAAERNIIFFITDDESPTLGCYGDKTARTPNIDAIAADGAVFLNAFATTAVVEVK